MVYLIVRPGQNVGTITEGGVLVVAQDDNANGGWHCRSVNPYEGEPQPFTVEEARYNDDLVYAKVQEVFDFETWGEVVEYLEVNNGWD